MDAIFKSLPPRVQCLLPYLVLVAAVFAAYANVYNNDFVFDDGLIITRNDLLHRWATFGKLFTASTTDGAHISGGFYRPLQLILYFFIEQLFGENPVAFHFLNVSLHAMNACLMFTLGRKLNFNLAGSFLASLVWAVHPLHTEAVTYMSATADPLFALFCMWGLLVLLPDFSMRRIWLSIPVFFLALASKETAVVFPLLAIVTLYYVSPHPLRPHTYLRTAPLLLIMGLYVLWRMTATGFDGPASYERLYQYPEFQNLKVFSEDFSLRFNTFLSTLPAYASLLLWPHDLHMERTQIVYADWGPPVFIGFMILTVVLIWILSVRGPKSLPLSWGFLWFGAAHFPDTGLLFSSNSLFLEHWMYLPSVGLFLGIAESLSRALEPARKTKVVLAVLTLIASGVLAVATFAQNMTWKDPVTFYTHIFKYGEISARSRNNLALALMDKQQYPEAVAEFRKAIQITDTYAETHHNLAVCLLNLPDREKHVQEAIDEFNRALAIDPNFVRSYIGLQHVYEYLHDTDKAAYNKQRAEELLATGH